MTRTSLRQMILNTYSSPSGPTLWSSLKAARTHHFEKLKFDVAATRLLVCKILSCNRSKSRQAAQNDQPQHLCRLGLYRELRLRSHSKPAEEARRPHQCLLSQRIKALETAA